jgi:predicted  nucleic acid-binding Zn-ribbon protein
MKIEVARAKVSEKSTAMYNNVLESHGRLKTLDKDLKNINKELQDLSKEREIANQQKTQAIKTYTKLELDVEDFEEKLNIEARSKVVQLLKTVFKMLI